MTEIKGAQPNHTLSVVIHSCGHVELKLVCSNHEALLCHYVCSDGCPSWLYDDHVFPDRRNGVEEGHSLTYRPICNAADWMNDGGLAEYFTGDDKTPLRDGMIVDVEWGGDNYLWKVPKS